MWDQSSGSRLAKTVTPQPSSGPLRHRPKTFRSPTGSGVEQMLRPRLLRTFVAVLAFFLSGCDKGAEPAPAMFVAYQVPGCTSHLGKRVLEDSCFSYEFHDALSVDFCATANCCPDSNRFSLSHRISGDSIIVTIADTAAQNCFCTCTYVLHVEFHVLAENSYLFVCERRDYSSHILLYAEPVNRH